MNTPATNPTPDADTDDGAPDEPMTAQEAIEAAVEDLDDIAESLKAIAAFCNELRPLVAYFVAQTTATPYKRTPKG